uniref:DNA polymerase n=1 Tax=Leptogium hirsutum TaxID=1486872 RepID=A0A1X9QGY9_9LECA|nr:DNA polymerase type B2 [Leptogium hirsutum]ARQ27106.1 DNA polymerase type B2 [Leptogium hirsutum]
MLHQKKIYKLKQVTKLKFSDNYSSNPITLFHTDTTVDGAINKNYILPLSPQEKEIKIKFVEIYFYMDELNNFEIFVSKLDILTLGTRYSILFRVCFGDSAKFKMLGSQLSFDVNDPSLKLDYLYQLHNNILTRLETSMLNYNFTGDDIITIQFLIYKVYYNEKIIKSPQNIFTLNKLGLNKDLVDTTIDKINLGYNKLLPLSMEISDYDKLVELDLKSYGNDKIVLDNNTKLFSDKDNKYVISLDTKYIEGYPNHDVNVYTPNGLKVLNILDKKINNNTFSRTVGNITNIISNNNLITNTRVKLKLDVVERPKIHRTLANLQINSPFIGSLDIETFKMDSISKVYALGYYTKRYGLKTFYINKDLNSDILVADCIDSLLNSKYNGYTFYVHNLGRFDSAFILKSLLVKNRTNEDKYIIDPLCRENNLILSLIITRKQKNKTYSIKLVDSYNILSHNLKSLCQTFQTETSKDIFPYNFVNKDTLFYSGIRPDIKYYNEDVTLETIQSIPFNDWNTERETIKYLNKDLISLFQVMNKFSDHIFLKYNVQVSSCLTISSIAMKIFLFKYYKDNLALINKRSVYEDIKLSYFGGVTEVYKPYGENLYYYDVNSLYPYVALNCMPGNNCIFENDINMLLKDMLSAFGFFYCSIKTTNSYLGLLPVRNAKGIIMPNGEWKGWYFSEQLKFAEKNGYVIKVLKGYHFDKIYGVFDSYVKDFYNIKANSKNLVEKSVAKRLLNHLLGRFGLNIYKPSTRLIDKHEFNDLSQSKQIINFINIEDIYLTSFINKTSKNICDQFNVDYKNTVINNLKSKQENEDTFKDVSIAIASAVTSYARIFMGGIKLQVLNNNGKIYYSDTDSLVTDKPLPDNIVGTNIGQFKLEYIMSKGYFISSKTYCLILGNGTPKITTKGVNDNKLNENSFIKLLKGDKVESQRFESISNFSEGYVNILARKAIVLDGDAYTKRTKIFIDNLWIDTKPLIIGDTDTPKMYTKEKEKEKEKEISLKADSYKKRVKLYQNGHWTDTKPIMLEAGLINIGENRLKVLISFLFILALILYGVSFLFSSSPEEWDDDLDISLNQNLKLNIEKKDMSGGVIVNDSRNDSKNSTTENNDGVIVNDSRNSYIYDSRNDSRNDSKNSITENNDGVIVNDSRNSYIYDYRNDSKNSITENNNNNNK